MKNFLTKTILLLTCISFFQIAFAQQSTSGVIKYSVFTSPELELNEELYLSNSTIEYPDKEFIDIITSEYLKMLFSNDKHTDVPFSIHPERYYPLTDILENKPQENFSNTIERQDSLYPIARQRFISKSGKVYLFYTIAKYDDYGEPTFDENGNVIYTNEYEMESNFSDIISNLFFTEKWDYQANKGKFIKEIQKINAGYQLNTDGETDYRTFPIFDLPIKNLNPGKKLIESIVYDVRISPYYYMANEESSYGYKTYIPDTYNYLDNKFREDLFSKLLNDLRNGIVKAYKVYDNEIDKSKNISYDEVLASLSETIFKTTANDVYKQRKFMNYKLSPQIKTYNEIEYIYDENGNYIYDDYGNYMFNYIPKSDTTGMDTIWSLKPQYREIVSIEDLTFSIEEVDENGTPVYNEFGEAVYKTVVKKDTTWAPTKEVLEFSNSEMSYSYKHDKMENFIGLRFYETWYFDENEFCIKKQVNAIGIIMDGICENTDKLRERYGLEVPLFNNQVKIYIQLKNE